MTTRNKLIQFLLHPRILWAFAGLAIAIAVTVYWLQIGKAGKEEYLTARVDVGGIRNVVSATGTVQAVTTVQVGSQVSGTIKALHADFNSEVRTGQVIAQLDPAMFQAQIAQARANLEQARANLADAEARVLIAQSTIENLRAGISSAIANLSALQAQRDDAMSLLERQRALAESGLSTERDLDQARTNYQSAEARYKQAAAQLEQVRVNERSAANAGLAQARAGVQQARGQVQQSTAALNLAEINLSHTTIQSPINGVVISRNVDVGQTVAASLQAPTLFTIANDLAQMQVIASIDQADIGVINPINRVSFSVDAFPGRNFTGTIRQIRLNPQNVQNVVTYNVVIDVANADLKLKPGMTANLTIVVAESSSALRIPNAALRFLPSGITQVQVREMLNEPGREEKSRAGLPTAAIIQGQRRIVWALGANQKPEPKKIRLGITDGAYTEVAQGELKAGDVIIIGQNITSTQRTTSTQTAPGFGGSPGRR